MIVASAASSAVRGTLKNFGPMRVRNFRQKIRRCFADPQFEFR